MKSIFFFGVCLYTIAFSSFDERPLVANRLRSVSLNEAKAFAKKHSDWYRDADLEQFFVPTKEQILSADTKFRPTLLVEAEKTSDEKYRKDGITAISSVAHMYCGCFFGYSCKGEKRISCIYNLVINLPDFEKGNLVWAGETWKGDSAGVSVRFDYILKEGSTTNFSISGNSAGPFGRQKLSLFEFSGEDIQSVRKIADQRPEFEINLREPFKIQLGRGSGLKGLTTITINESGNVVVLEPENSRSCNFSISKHELTSILKSVSSNRLMSLYKAYHDDDINDGTQWIFLIQQGANRKSIYFNNYFPKQIRAFGNRLDEVLSMDNRELTWSSSEEVSDLWGTIDK